MRAMHEHPVPDESKEEEKTKRCNECDEEFFPVHNLFRVRFLLSPRRRGIFIAKWRIVVDSKFLGASRSPTNDEAPTAFFVLRISSFLRHWTFVIRHSIRFNIQSQLAQ